MKQFITDSQGGNWEFQLDIPAYRRVKAECRADLGLAKYDFGGVPLVVAIYDSPIVFLDVLYAVLVPQVVTKNLTRDDFDTRFSGPKHTEARNLFMEQWALFCQSLGKTQEGEAIRAFTKSVTMATAEATSLLRSSGFGDQSTTSLKSGPESQESPTSTASPSANSNAAPSVV